VVENWLGIMRRTKRLTAFTASYSQAAVIFPYILVAPAYFAEKVQLGGMMQTASAFGSVQDSLSFIITSYRTIAEWQSVVQRLDGFETSIENAAALTVTRDVIHVRPGDDGAIDLDKLVVGLPAGTPLVAADGFSIRGHQRTLITGPSGAGKSTLFRAIAGVWPFGSGTIAIPPNASLMVLPQRPYFPVGSLKAAAVYPAEADAFGDERVKEVLVAVGLAQLTGRLQEDGHWNRMLSLGEQQRLGLARALLHAPQYLFLDEATASLDEASEASLYRLLEEKMPAATIVSIGHRSTLKTFHQRRVALTPEGDRSTLQDERESVEP
jgi:vitamin B12/bleomycin/antimicrobial peptide transport system ATP-binding/permease protein